MKFVILFLIILSLPLVSAELEIGFETSNLPLVDIQTPALPTFNNNTAYVNSTSIWVTDEGDMENVPDLFPTLTGEYLELDGSNANQDIDISPYDLTIGEKLLFALGETIDNIRDGWIKVTGGLEVNGPMNITDPDNGIATYFENGYLVVEG